MFPVCPEGAYGWIYSRSAQQIWRSGREEDQDHCSTCNEWLLKDTTDPGNETFLLVLLVSCKHNHLANDFSGALGTLDACSVSWVLMQEGGVDE